MILLESRSVLGAKFSSAYTTCTSTGTSKYIKIVKNHYPANLHDNKIVHKNDIWMRRAVKTLDDFIDGFIFLVYGFIPLSGNVLTFPLIIRAYLRPMTILHGGQGGQSL